MADRTPTSTHASLAERAAFWLLALVAIRWVAPAGPLYWDSFGYTAQAVSGQVGGLGLGRPLFILLSHGLSSLALSLSAGVSSIEPLLRAAWSMVAALSAPLTLATASELGLDRREQRWAALCVALSPAMAHASGQVLTDGPAVTAVLASTLFAARAIRSDQPDGAREALLWLASGATFGAAVVCREPAIAHALVLYGLIALGAKGTRSRSVVIITAALIVVAGLSLVWAARQPGWADTVRNWAAAMRRERAEHPYSLRDFAMYLGWLVAMGPVMLLAAIAGWARARGALWARSKALFVVCAGALAQLVALGAYQDIAFSPRYLLGAMPFALALVAGVTLARWAQTRARIAVAAGAMALVTVVSGAVMTRRERPLRVAMDTVAQRLRDESPGRSLVIVTGQVCPAVQLARKLERAQWTTVCPGWDWPTDLTGALDAHLARGAVVIADLREGVWVGERQLRARAALAAWAQRASAERVRIWR